jgi:hypothetical protein
MTADMNVGEDVRFFLAFPDSDHEAKAALDVAVAKAGEPHPDSIPDLLEWLAVKVMRGDWAKTFAGRQRLAVASRQQTGKGVLDYFLKRDGNEYTEFLNKRFGSPGVTVVLTPPNYRQKDEVWRDWKSFKPEAKLLVAGVTSLLFLLSLYIVFLFRGSPSQLKADDIIGLVIVGAFVTVLANLALWTLGVTLFVLLSFWRRAKHLARSDTNAVLRSLALPGAAVAAALVLGIILGIADKKDGLATQLSIPPMLVVFTIVGICFKYMGDFEPFWIRANVEESEAALQALLVATSSASDSAQAYGPWNEGGYNGWAWGSKIFQTQLVTAQAPIDLLSDVAGALTRLRSGVRWRINPKVVGDFGGDTVRFNADTNYTTSQQPYLTGSGGYRSSGPSQSFKSAGEISLECSVSSAANTDVLSVLLDFGQPSTPMWQSGEAEAQVARTLAELTEIIKRETGQAGGWQFAKGDWRTNQVIGAYNGQIELKRAR